MHISNRFTVMEEKNEEYATDSKPIRNWVGCVTAYRSRPKRGGEKRKKGPLQLWRVKSNWGGSPLYNYTNTLDCSPVISSSMPAHQFQRLPSLPQEKTHPASHSPSGDLTRCLAIRIRTPSLVTFNMHSSRDANGKGSSEMLRREQAARSPCRRHRIQRPRTNHLRRMRTTPLIQKRGMHLIPC